MFLKGGTLFKRYLPRGEDEEEDEDEEPLPNEEFNAVSRYLIKANFDQNISDPLKELLDWGEEAGECPTSVRGLLQSQEYVTFKALAESQLFPPITGYCNSYYGMVYLSALPYARITLSEKLAVEIALMIMDYVDAATEQGLQFCDVKLGHFAMTSDGGGILFVDGDSVQRETALRSSMSYQSCVHDADCDYFDCKFACLNGSCGDIRSSVSATVCDKVFDVPSWYLVPFAPGPLVGGLLSRIPNEEMGPLLNECRQGKGHSKLYAFLTRLLRSDGSNVM